MTPEETELIRRYIAGELTPAAVEIAELLILVDAEGAAMVDAWNIERDADAVPSASSQTPL